MYETAKPCIFIQIACFFIGNELPCIISFLRNFVVLVMLKKNKTSFFVDIFTRSMTSFKVLSCAPVPCDAGNLPCCSVLCHKNVDLKILAQT